MTNIDSQSPNVALELAGFCRSSRTTKLFLIDDKSPITPAYYCLVNRKKGKVQFGGGFGTYFREFEQLWHDSLSREERKLDLTLPLIMSIDNYLELVDEEVFRFSDTFDEILDHALRIYNFCLKFPKSIEEFDKALMDGAMLGKRVSDYLHMFDYYESDNLYFRKSASFVRWFADAWPEQAPHMHRCLTSSQLERLALR